MQMYDPAQVSNLSHELVQWLGGRSEDIGVKIAALKTAASTFENTIQSQTMAGVINNLLNAPK